MEETTEVVKEKFSVREDGVEILRVGISYEVRPGADRFNELYETVGRNCALWARGTAARRARDDYLACEDPDKRFYYRGLEYRFEARVTAEDDEGLCVLTDATLSRRGGTGAPDVLERGRTSQFWRKSDWCLMPDAAVLPKKKSKSLRAAIRRRPIGFYLSGDCLFAFGKDWDEAIET